MDVYYHCDRTESLKPGTVIEPEPYRPEESRIMLLGRCIDSEFYRHLAEMMRKGISLHGARYLMMADQKPDFESMTTELVYEEYRWRNRLRIQSRLQSLFAWRNLADAVRFGREAGSGRIYRVRCSDKEKPLPHDMNGLQLSFSAEEQARYTALYWEGKPFCSDANYEPCWEYLLRLPVTVLEEVSINPLKC